MYGCMNVDSLDSFSCPTVISLPQFRDYHLLTLLAQVTVKCVLMVFTQFEEVEVSAAASRAHGPCQASGGPAFDGRSGLL